MDWSPENLKGAADRYARAVGEGGFIKDGLSAVMSYAVELAAARGGTMTAEQLDIAFDDINHRADNPNAVPHLREHITAQGATVATLQTRVEELEASLRHADVSLNLVGGERRALQAQLDAAREDYRCACETRESLSAEVERLKGRVAFHMDDAGRMARESVLSDRRAAAAEARLAAIRERACDEDGLMRAYDLEMEKIRKALLSVGRWVLEGDAPNSPGSTEGSEPMPKAPHGETGRCKVCGGPKDGPHKMSCRPQNRREAERYPCSTTPTAQQHDVLDGEAPQEATAEKCYAPRHINCPCGWDPPQACHYPTPESAGETPQEATKPCGAVRKTPDGLGRPVVCSGRHTLREGDHISESGEVFSSLAAHYPCSPTCTHYDAATPGHPERVRERSEAVVAELNHAADRSEDWRLGYSDGLEAMRTACLDAVTNYMRAGFGGMPPALKAAIEGAAP